MIIFMGVAGSGKSVQGRLLADTLGLPWLSTGEFLRMLISGQRRKDMQAGKLLDIDCLNHLIIGHTYVSLKERGLGFD